MQLAAVEGMAELVLELEAILDALAHRRVEHRDGVAAGVLGLVHRDVRVAQHRLGAGGRIGPPVDGDAHAGRHGDLDVADPEAAGQAQAGALGQLADVVGLAHAPGDDDELVPTDAGHEITGSTVGLEPLAHRGQQLVAETVPEAVVQEPEPVDVEEHQGDGLVRTSGQQLLDVIAHRRAVGQPGERVVGGLMCHPRLGPGVLAQRPEHPPGRRRGAGDHDGGEDEPIGESVLAPAEGDHGGNAERDRDEHEATAARLGRQPAYRA